MLRLATAELSWATVDDLEIRRPEPSFSYLTAETVAGQYPTARLFWIMGGDQWLALPSWRHPERLAEVLEFIVLDRGDPSLPYPGFRMHRIAGDHPASATAIRNALASGASPEALTWLPAPVADYIHHRGLYRQT